MPTKTRAKKTVGIIAFQGDVIEHERILKKLGHAAVQVRTPQDLKLCDALIIPGGESTTIGFFLEQSGLASQIKTRAKKGMPIWGTCAGSILLAKNIQANIVPPHLGIMDITVRRNAYGTQIDSFYANIQIPKLKIANLKAAFIRAPIIEKVGPGVEILATQDQKIIMAKQGNILATTFHPELRNETRIHEHLLSLI